jgi:predicted amino acid racemase
LDNCKRISTTEIRANTKKTFQLKEVSNISVMTVIKTIAEEHVILFAAARLSS